MTPFGDRQEAVRCPCSVDCINRHFDGAIGSVFKTNRAGQTRCQLAVHLRFCCSCPNRAPAHQIGEILWGDHIEEFTRSRQSAVVDIQQQFTRNAQPIIDLEAVVHVRVVDKPFPANGGTRFFKIDAHDDFKLTF